MTRIGGIVLAVGAGSAPAAYAGSSDVAGLSYIHLPRQADGGGLSPPPNDRSSPYSTSPYSGSSKQTRHLTVRKTRLGAWEQSPGGVFARAQMNHVLGSSNSSTDSSLSAPADHLRFPTITSAKGRVVKSGSSTVSP